MPGGVALHQRALAIVPATLVIAWLALACEPTVLIGTCSPASGEDAGAAGAAGDQELVSVPWSTGFEDGLCGYRSAGGFCYARHDASIEIVESPTPHSGKFSAAFTVNGNATTADRSQARCVREGVMPKSAYYGAWYRVPAVRADVDNWNLFHFEGLTSAGDPSPLWDVSLANNAKGGLQLAVRNFLTATDEPISVDSIPIDRWFHVEMQIVRSAQANGEITVLQDDVSVLHRTNLITDDTEWSQWFVGNYAKTLTPSLSTVYVDDITIREER
ncbi:MAG TPA: heparin lyase I family protein [Polyangiaceae bacterium]|nr:heparin lyase I family protein [Polyangiaceae bacterium]